MTTNEDLIKKYKMKASSKKITFVTTKDISKKIIATLVTHPNSYENIWSGWDNFDTEITIDLNYTANLDNFLTIHDIRTVFTENFSSF
ncbi:hypothetical protein [Flavobacterium degerlachei]|jgi:hypothetical protein|uniref:Uncharacterized protein n=1 Tax=Flavobacterium degerlachei TaxID=229203 RepID=A0A1H3GLZ6_9FLAO|nr:hypothetical protein [Flavobacterium degerlachei]SDY04343.1 hypothetical protein SAMN05444338_12418 [Flavobacterium degerlachei]